MKSILILGATSGIARATALEFSNKGWIISLAGRNTNDLKNCANDLAVRSGREVLYYKYDACDKNNTSLLNQLPVIPDAILCAVGMLGDQKKAEQDAKYAEQIICTNYTGLVPILSQVANLFEERGSGHIIGISSVAGDRGRASNYFYGSAKAGFTAFLSGLRQRLYKKGIHILTIKPGFVNTKMIKDMNLPTALMAQPQEVAQDIYQAVLKKKSVVYSKWFWQWIMFIVRFLPEFLFQKKIF